MLDGASLLTAMFWGMRAAQTWTDVRGGNILDSGAPWYDCYETADGEFVAIGAIEPKFYRQLLERMGLEAESLPAQHDRTGWPRLRERFGQVFRSRTREEWCRVFEGSDACFAPVLTFDEAAAHPHAVARGAHQQVDDVMQPAPAPRFSRTAAAITRAPPQRGHGGREALADWGFSAAETDALEALGAGFASR
jgi:alpha-methylacyl-CoA racemase